MEKYVVTILKEEVAASPSEIKAKLQERLGVNADDPKYKDLQGQVEDEYLDKNSEKFHKHLGYRLVGEFYDCGYKFNRWYNMIWMEKMIGEHN